MIEQLPLAAVATGWTTGAFVENEWGKCCIFTAVLDLTVGFVITNNRSLVE